MPGFAAAAPEPETTTGLDSTSEMISCDSFMLSKLSQRRSPRNLASRAHDLAPRPKRIDETFGG